MNRIKLVNVLLAVCLICSFNDVFAQIKEPRSKIMVIAKAYKDSVLLRWAPDNEGAWQTLNKNGYIIKRATVSKNGSLNPRPTYKQLAAVPIKPWPKAQWESMVIKEDKYGTIAAQALYGDDFEITQEIKGNPAALINLIKQNEQRFSFALFSADQSFAIAKGLGLAFTDSTTKPNEKYKYLILSAAGKKVLSIDTGLVVTSFAEAKPLPKPKGLKAQAQEKGVMLSWLTRPFLGIYTYYQTERSEDGGQTYINTSSIPVVNTQENGDIQDAEKAFELDSVSALNRVLVYRVKGVSPFGEVGPPSDTIHVTAYYQLGRAPIIKSAKDVKETVQIDWTLPETKAEVIGFDVERSKSKEKGFVKINSIRLSPKDSSFIDIRPNPINFYRIRVYAKGSPSMESFSSLVQMPDSIPPVPPTGASGLISKAGIVKLKWNANKEPDLYGYRVFRSNSENGEYAQVTRNTQLTNSFTDTIELKTLTKYVYYKFVAIDKRYNPSKFSEVLRLKRPDIVPPAPPALTSIKALPNGISLSWYNSVSEDVVKHELLRTVAGKEDWKVLVFFTDTTKKYLDESAVLNQKYSYKLRAIDDSYLNSESKPFTSQRLDLGLKPDVLTFSGTADRDNQQIILKWAYKEPGVINYVLYKAEQGKPLRLYKTLGAKLDSFADSQLYINTEYEYRLKAIFADGVETRFSKEIRVNY